MWCFMINMHFHIQISEGGWISDSDGALRCSDCNLFPAAEECGESIFIIHVVLK